MEKLSCGFSHNHNPAMLSSHKQTKDKPKKWGDPDQAKLLYLIDTGKVDIKSSGALELENVKFIYNEYFGEHKYGNPPTREGTN